MILRMRILFAGSPAIAAPCLDALAGLALTDGSFELAGVLTNPDSMKGRNGKAEATDVGARAEELSARLEGAGKPRFSQAGKPAVPVLKPETLNAEARKAVAALKPDVLVSFAYGRIFGPKFLALFPMGGINVHPSLLPRYRGPSPVQAVILNRERETGVSIQRIAAEMDTGDILVQERFPLTGKETAASLSETVALKSAALLPEALRGILHGGLAGIPQAHGEASYCALISKEDGRIDWSRSAAEIDARIRAFTPWPLCWTIHGDTECYILEGQVWDGPTGTGTEPGKVAGLDKKAGILIQTGDGVFAVSRLQYRAKKALAWKDFLNGARNFIGANLI
jgi:methionyl-tRNA formyltransferase